MPTTSPTTPAISPPDYLSPIDDFQSTTSTNTIPAMDTPAYTVMDPSSRSPGLMLPPPHPPSSPTKPILSPSVHHTPPPPHNSTTTSTIDPAPSPSPRTLKIQTEISTLQAQISSVQTNLDETLAQLQHHLAPPPGRTKVSSPSTPPLSDQAALQAQAESIVKRHIKLLHTYNEIKDVGQGLMGLIADARGVRVKEVMEEMEVGEKDGYCRTRQRT